MTSWTIQSMEFSRLEYRSVGSLSLLQGIFPTQRLNLGLLHCRQILYHLSHEGSSFTALEGVKDTYYHKEKSPGPNSVWIFPIDCVEIPTDWSGLPFPSPGDLPDPDRTCIPCIASRFFTAEPAVASYLDVCSMIEQIPF